MIAQTILITLSIVVFATWIVRRLLGIRSGQWAATAGAVLVGETLTVGILYLVLGRVVDLPWQWYPVGCALVVILSLNALATIRDADETRCGPRWERRSKSVASLLQVQ